MTYILIEYLPKLLFIECITSTTLQLKIDTAFYILVKFQKMFVLFVSQVSTYIICGPVSKFELYIITNNVVKCLAHNFFLSDLFTL